MATELRACGRRCDRSQMCRRASESLARTFARKRRDGDTRSTSGQTEPEQIAPEHRSRLSADVALIPVPFRPAFPIPRGGGAFTSIVSDAFPPCSEVMLAHG